MVGNEQRWVGSQKSCNLCRLVARNENADLFLGERFLVNLDIIQEIPSIENVAAMGYACECIPCKPTTRVTRGVGEAEVIVSGV